METRHLAAGRLRLRGGPTLVGKTDRDAVLAQVQDGGGGMPAFKGSLTEQQIQDVVSYVTEKVAPG